MSGRTLLLVHLTGHSDAPSAAPRTLGSTIHFFSTNPVIQFTSSAASIMLTCASMLNHDVREHPNNVVLVPTLDSTTLVTEAKQVRGSTTVLGNVRSYIEGLISATASGGGNGSGASADPGAGAGAADETAMSVPKYTAAVPFDPDVHRLAARVERLGRAGDEESAGAGAGAGVGAGTGGGNQGGGAGGDAWAGIRQSTGTSKRNPSPQPAAAPIPISAGSSFESAAEAAGHAHASPKDVAAQLIPRYGPLVDIGANFKGDKISQALLKRSASVGVTTIILTGTSVEGSETALLLCKKYSKAPPSARASSAPPAAEPAVLPVAPSTPAATVQLYSTVGIHPHDAKKYTDYAGTSQKLKELAAGTFWWGQIDCP